MNRRKRQIICIHGGHASRGYSEYMQQLKDYEIDRKKIFEKSDWKSHLSFNLGRNFEVIRPNMPCKQNAKYAEWKIWFEKYIPYMKDDIILVGHSLGGIFLAKYLSENKLPVKISSVHLVAAPFYNKSLRSFRLPKKLEGFSRQSRSIYLYHSIDDPIVPFSHLEKYFKALPGAKKIILKKKGHVKQEKFSELIKNIKS